MPQHLVIRRVLVLCLALAACGRAQGPITIGSAGPWTTGFGQMNRRGIELAVQEINQAGGINGRQLSVTMRDDSGDGARAAAIAGQFVANPAIVAVVGHLTSGAMVAAAKVYDGTLAAVATTATSPDLTGISPWVFRVISSDSANGIALARFAGTLGRRRAAILYENDSYGRGLTEAFRRAFQGEIVSVDPIVGGAQDFEPFVSFYRRRAPDLVFVAGTEASGIALLREARRQRLAADFLGADGWTGIVADTAAAEGAYVGAPFSAEDPRPEARRFVQQFRAKYGITPDGNAALGYDATRLVARAIAAVGPDRRAIRDYLAGLDASSAFPGVTGAIRFTAGGDPVDQGIVMTRVRAGALVVAGGRS